MLTTKTQAILLLTSYFSSADDKQIRPLSNREWGKFALWLKDHELSPEQLLDIDLQALLASWSDKKITLERLQALLKRGSAMALALEKWSRTGIWVMVRSDADYPRRLKQTLGQDAPPVLFGSGNRSLLDKGGIAAVGSRNTSDEDLDYSKQLGALAAATGISVISGGARGVDESAMLGTLEAEGMAVGVLANDLLRTANSAKYRKHLLNNNLVLVSPYYPEAGFNAGNAMQRNKYIYCLADAAIAVHSGTKGGTWEGVLENLKNDWVPIWIKHSKDPEAGNDQLVKKGARYLPVNFAELELQNLVELSTGKRSADTPQLFNQPPLTQTVTASTIEQPASVHSVREPAPAQEIEQVQLMPPVQEDAPSFYEFFLSRVQTVCSKTALTVEQLQEETNLHKSQLTAWLKQGLADGHLKKLNKPLRYQWQNTKQSDMFQDK